VELVRPSILSFARAFIKLSNIESDAGMTVVVDGCRTAVGSTTAFSTTSSFAIDDSISVNCPRGEVDEFATLP
jgi:hypothetical protein